eukprot:8222031-Pyramimonas_sp.AAC.1
MQLQALLSPKAKPVELTEHQKQVVGMARLAYAACMVVSSLNKISDAAQRTVASSSAYNWAIMDGPIKMDDFPEQLKKKIQPFVSRCAAMRVSESLAGHCEAVRRAQC